MLHLEPWQPETARTVTVPFAWKPDTWYRMKLQVENLPDGKVRARGKVWPRRSGTNRLDESNDRSDCHSSGAPGILAALWPKSFLII
jgi:hypothetical protein